MLDLQLMIKSTDCNLKKENKLELLLTIGKLQFTLTCLCLPHCEKYLLWLTKPH